VIQELSVRYHERSDEEDAMLRELGAVDTKMRDAVNGRADRALEWTRRRARAAVARDATAIDDGYIAVDADVVESAVALRLDRDEQQLALIDNLCQIVSASNAATHGAKAALN